MMVRLRNSERGTHKTCPYQWWWGIRQGLKPRQTGKARWFGQGIHLALAHYYQPGLKRNTDMVDVWRNFAREEAEVLRTRGAFDEEQWTDAYELGEAMLIHYMKHWGSDDDWDVIHPEYQFQVRIPFDFDSISPAMAEILHDWLADNGFDTEFFELDGTFDGVYRSRRTKRIKLMEHKTAAQIRTEHLTKDDQAGTYGSVAQTKLHHDGILNKGENIREITWNFLRKAKPDDRPQNEDGHYLNKDGSVSRRQPADYFHREPVERTPRQVRTQLQRLKDEMNVMLGYRSGALRIIKNPRDHCSWCPFKEMCELHEIGADWEQYRDMLYRVEDPYADHRKAA